ncbi:MAG: hypothetical protein GY894_03875 [Planctomycetes bacterium]|nr:hypothetical protein [Planctomycetota bacterium]
MARMKRMVGVLAVAVTGSSLLAMAETGEPTAAASPPSEMQYIRMNTNKGDMVIMLDPVAAPLTVENFTSYAKKGAYDGTIFHRVIPNFMVQGGGFAPGLKKQPTDAPVKNEWKNGLKNERGTIAMARRGGLPDSATSQFFINVEDNKALDLPRDGAAYAVFGKVVAGDGVLDAIKAVKTGHAHGPGGGEFDDVPVEDVVIEQVTMLTPAEAEAISTGCTSGTDQWRTTQLAAADEMKKQAEQQSARQEKLTMSVDNVLANPTELPGEAVGDKASSSSDTGLAWFDLEEGSGAAPASPQTTVRVHYTGYLIDGTKFDSSVDRGQPIDFPLNRVIPGWTEGVGSMKVGGKRKLVIPSALGYGSKGTPGGPIPPNATLVFDVELLELP